MKYHLQLHLLVVILAATALLGELISIPAAALVAWRTLLAAAGACLWVTVVRRRSVWPGGRAAAALLGVGVLVGLHWVLFFQAIKMAGVSICLAGLATIPLFTAFTEPVFERRRLRPFEIVAGILVFCGITIIGGTIRPEGFPGLACALASALLAAIFPLLNRRIVSAGGDPPTMVTWEMAGAFAATICLLPVLGGGDSLFAWSGLDWLWLLVLSLVCTVFAHGFQIHLLRHLGAFTINLAISFEPLYGILAAAVLFREHEQLTPAFCTGLSAILAANVMHPLFVRMARRNEP